MLAQITMPTKYDRGVSGYAVGGMRIVILLCVAAVFVVGWRLTLREERARPPAHLPDYVTISQSQ